ncbi:MAG: hypothetical protein GY708_01125, partial [Actinomycetia bacterium]|nr:hypothetical protein [Actinomycetes bacterium]
EIQPLTDALPDATPIDPSTVTVLEHGLRGLKGVDVKNDIVRKFRNDIVRKFEAEVIDEFRNDIVRKFKNDIVRKFKNDIVRRFEAAHIPAFGVNFDGTQSTDNATLSAATGSLPWPAPIELDTTYHFYLDLDRDDSTGAYPADVANPSKAGENFPGTNNFVNQPDIAVEAGVDLIAQLDMFAQCNADTCDTFAELRVFDYNDGTGEYEEVLFQNDPEITVRGLGLYQNIDGEFVELENIPVGLTLQPQIPISILENAGWSFEANGEPGAIRMEVVSSIDCAGNIVNGDPSSTAIDCTCTDCTVCPDYPGCVGTVGTPETLNGTRILTDCREGEMTFEPPRLPQCALSPALVQAGDSVTAYLTQLPTNIDDETVELRLNEVLLGSTSSSLIDSEGGIAIAATLPVDATGVLRISARITDTAVSVSCFADATPTTPCVDSDGDGDCNVDDPDDDNDGIPD